MAGGSEYNPSIKDDIPSTYRCWYVLVTLFSILCGAAIIAISITMKVMDDDLGWLVCHIWTGIPLFVSGFIAIIPCATRCKKYAVIYLVFMAGCLCACAAGAIINGLEYWTKYGAATKLSMDAGKCSVVQGACKCASIPQGIDIPLMITVDNCDDLKVLVRLFISLIALDVFGFIISTIGAFLAFMSVCCGPWVFLATYSKSQDPDFTSIQPVRHTGTTNKGYN